MSHRQDSGVGLDVSLGDPFGAHRVLEPRGALPQAALRLNADPALCYPDELHIAVETLNVDSASMRQLEEAEGGDAGRVGDRILSIVGERGKLQNPVTGSGGMLLGRVAWIGPSAPERGLRVGDRVATLVSLTLTPLTLRAIHDVRLDTHQVTVEGTAVVFASGQVVRMPEDLPENLALGALDVAGAAPQVLRMASPGESVLILGVGGKSGLLCAAAARERVTDAGCVVGVERIPEAATVARALGHCDAVLEGDAADPLATRAQVLAVVPERVRSQGGFDRVVSCVNVAGAEMAAILLCRERGQIYFFSMATSFSRAALGAEGVSKDIDMLIGNGYCVGHASETLALLRRQPALRQELQRRFGA
jgi:L-erythro-3,5-diaminohexanoate dehydrogenase